MCLEAPYCLSVDLFLQPLLLSSCVVACDILGIMGISGVPVEGAVQSGDCGRGRTGGGIFLALTRVLALVEVPYVKAWLVGQLPFLVLALEEVMFGPVWMLVTEMEEHQVLEVFDQLLSMMLVEAVDRSWMLAAELEEH